MVNGRILNRVETSDSAVINAVVDENPVVDDTIVHHIESQCNYSLNRHLKNS